MGFYIVKGDKTSSGGNVIEGWPMQTAGDFDAACVGHKATCPVKGHGSIVTIITGDNSMLIHGRAWARHGDSLSCGCRLIAGRQTDSTFSGASSQMDRNADAPKPAAADTTAGEAGTAAASQSKKTDEKYDQHFALFDEATKEPLKNRYYKITFKGQEITGKTDNTGKTQLVKDSSAETPPSKFIQKATRVNNDSTSNCRGHGSTDTDQ